MWQSNKVIRKITRTAQAVGFVCPWRTAVVLSLLSPFNSVFPINLIRGGGMLMSQGVIVTNELMWPSKWSPGFCGCSPKVLMLQRMLTAQRHRGMNAPWCAWRENQGCAGSILGGESGAMWRKPWAVWSDPGTGPAQGRGLHWRPCWGAFPPALSPDAVTSPPHPSVPGHTAPVSVTGFFYCRCWFFFGVLFVCFVVLFWFFSCQEEAAKYVLDFVSKDENMEVKPNRQTPRRQSLLTFFHRKLQGHRFTVGVRQMKRLQSHLLILSPPVRNVWHRCKCIAWDASGLLRTVNGRSACLPLILGSLLQKHHWTFIKTVFGYTESCFLPPCLPPVEAKYSKWENLQLTPCFGTSQLKVRLSLLQEPGSCSKSPSNPKCGCSEGGSLWERLTAMGNGELDVPLAPLQTCPVSCLEQHPQTCLRKKNICSSMSTRAPPKHRQIVLSMV